MGVMIMYHPYQHFRFPEVGISAIKSTACANRCRQWVKISLYPHSILEKAEDPKAINSFCNCIPSCDNCMHNELGG